MYYVKMIKMLDGKEVISYSPIEFVSPEEAERYCKSLKKKNPDVYKKFWIKKERGTWKELTRDLYTLLFNSLNDGINKETKR